MQTYFVRHTTKLDINAETRRRLWRERRIAIHFPHDRAGRLQRVDNSSLDLEDYPPKGRRALKPLLALAGDGGYVCAQHHGHEEVQVGFVPSGSNIQLFEGSWGSRYGIEGRPAILKTIQLRKVRIVKPSECVVILVGRPRQGTIMRWPSAGKLIQNLVNGAQQAASLDSLSPDQQEILCAEFLRSEASTQHGLPRLAHLLLPVGRTMKDIDILGIAADLKRLFAQVTFVPLKQIDRKLSRLRAYDNGQGEHLILFCDVERPVNRERVMVFPVRTAFEAFTGSLIGQQWLRHAGTTFR